jgi:UDP-2,3-diacylglucosamine hydrolase
MAEHFISDLHLTADRPDLIRAFENFLVGLTAADRLFILGDLFEVWLGDDDSGPFVNEVTAAMRVCAAGSKNLMHGNRDFLLGDDFCRRTGFDLLDDPSRLEIGGETVLVMHGDSLCTRDEEYMKARLILRSDGFRADFLSRTLPERAAFAASLRKDSQAHTRESAADIMDVTPTEVVRTMRDEKVRLMIHGHTHRPAQHAVPEVAANGKRIVLGDWDASAWVLRHEDGRYELSSWPIGTEDRPARGPE